MVETEAPGCKAPKHRLPLVSVAELQGIKKGKGGAFVFLAIYCFRESWNVSPMYNWTNCNFKNILVIECNGFTGLDLDEFKAQIRHRQETKAWRKICFNPQQVTSTLESIPEKLPSSREECVDLTGQACHTLTGVYFRDKNAPEHAQLTEYNPEQVSWRSQIKKKIWLLFSTYFWACLFHGHRI